MHELFNRPPSRFNGAYRFPELPYLQRTYARQLDDVKSYYRRYPKQVDSRNPLANILLHIPRRWDLDDRRYVRFVEDTAKGLIRVFNFTDSTHKGKVHEGGITLGTKTDEIVISSFEDFDVGKASRDWRTWAAYRYLYHTRIDLGLPVLNNSSPGKGWGVGVINIPMLALQYRYWLKSQAERGSEQSDTVYRFVGSMVLPNTLESYLDVAFFNRLARQSRGIGMPRFPVPHPFYLADYSSRVDGLGKKILETQMHRNADIEQLPFSIPVLVKDNLTDVMAIPRDPVTRHNDWALQLARLPYVRYIVEATVEHGRGDRHYTNEVYSSLIDASYDRIFSGIGSPTAVQHYREEIRKLIGLIEERGHGWA